MITMKLPDPYGAQRYVLGTNELVWHALHHLQQYCYPILEALELVRDGYCNISHGSMTNCYLECIA